MKLNRSVVASLLASLAAARPHKLDEGDPLPATSRITAFIIDEKGNPAIECWEITNIVESMQIQRADGVRSAAHALQLAKRGDLEGLEIITWPTYSPIWPLPDNEARTNAAFDLANSFNLFSIQGGLIKLAVAAAQSNSVAEEYEDHIFSLENGDDWFYFEDQYTDSDLARSAASAPPPFSLSTVSGSETEVMRLRFQGPPKHKVLHKGGCAFTGIRTDTDALGGMESSRAHSPLTVQVRIEEDL